MRLRSSYRLPLGAKVCISSCQSVQQSFQYQAKRHLFGQQKQRQTTRERRRNLWARWASNPYFYYQVGGFGLFCGGFYVYNLETVPISGRRRFNVVSPERERDMAHMEYAQLIDQMKDNIVPEWHPKVIRVKRVLAKLIAGLSNLEEEGQVAQADRGAAVTAGRAPWCKDDGLDAWTVHVVDAPIMNAMVLPGNKVFIFTEMLKICDNDAAIATVLSHEISHSICHHAAERMSSRSLFWTIMILISLLIGDFTLTSGVALDLFWQRPMGRTQESEADRVGVQLMAASCYDPRQSLLFWQRMAQFTKAQKAKVPEFLSTHPDDNTRIRQLEGWMQSAWEKYQRSDCASTGGFMQDFLAFGGNLR